MSFKLRGGEIKIYDHKMIYMLRNWITYTEKKIFGRQRVLGLSNIFYLSYSFSLPSLCVTVFCQMRDYKCLVWEYVKQCTNCRGKVKLHPSSQLLRPPSKNQIGLICSKLRSWGPIMMPFCVNACLRKRRQVGCLRCELPRSQVA